MSKLLKPSQIEDLALMVRNGKGLEPSQVVELAAAAQHYLASASWLASCHAANLEDLPRSASKRSRLRMESICEKGSQLLAGQPVLPHPQAPDSSASRCRKAVESSRLLREQ